MKLNETDSTDTEHANVVSQGSRARPARVAPNEVLVRAWADPVVDRLGHDPRSPYVERFWLSVLGPSTTLLLRRFAEHLDASPEGVQVDLGLLARSLGLGAKNAPNSPLNRAIRRACSFGLARFEGRDALAVRRKVPPLTRTQVNRLPELLRQEHAEWANRSPAQPSPEETRRRARRLALSLVELGEDLEATERQLHRWRFHPALAHEAAAWAFGHHHEARVAAGRRPLPSPGDAA